MSVIQTARLPASSSADLEQMLADLQTGARRLSTLTTTERQRLLAECIRGVSDQAAEWVRQACHAKRIPEASPARAEEMMAGPLIVLRYLHLLSHTLGDIQRYGVPQLPSRPFQRNGRLRVPVFPTLRLCDKLIFRPLTAETWMQVGVTPDELFGVDQANIAVATGTCPVQPQLCLVLGAGNVSSIPITDALTRLFQGGCVVLLKMSPVNEYLGPIFERAFASLVRTDLLKFAYGGADVGAQLIAHRAVDRIHITGSDRSHDAIVWGRDIAEQRRRQRENCPLLDKPMTSELGNVSPWIIVPGAYTKQQLYFQAENIAASITNNASFNCIATKMLVTSRRWPQRREFLDLVDSILAGIGPRYPYYPGAHARYERYSGQSVGSDDDALPWTLLREVDPTARPHLLEQESFVCVCGETTLDAANEDDFLTKATDFVNEQMWGTLSVAMTVPASLQYRRSTRLDQAIDRLRYGTIGINQWPGVAFALMSAPWGAFPGSTLADIQSGIGHVHSTYLLDRAEKTVLSSPLTMFPKPMWFSTHRRPAAVARQLLELYKRPSLWRFPAVLLQALQG